MYNRIPLFPLELVIFPESKYPLYIFEERYKILIGECLKNNSGFIISSVINDKISVIGTIVKVSKVLKKYENGEMEIIVSGASRIKINAIDNSEVGYLVADCTEIKEATREINEKIKLNVKSNFEILIEMSGINLSRAFWESYDKTKYLSFKVAEKIGMDLIQKQVLLSLEGENERLQFVLEYLERIIRENLKESDFKKLLLGDGYIN
ncbi:MAG: LON peptidase substrate-binding domain-containing protein [Ignavibacteriaceae bacterium]|nr:LON peptidase substrate-binding domain-containing protein [Ignavibacteriaceae bacterium]